MAYKFVRASADKPHRCPLCWKIAPRAWHHGKARWWWIYRCPNCNVRWIRWFMENEPDYRHRFGDRGF